MSRKYTGLRRHGFDPMTSFFLAFLSCAVGQPNNIVCVLNIEYAV